VDAVRRNAARPQAKRHFFRGREVALHARDEPHVVQVVVGDLQPHRVVDASAVAFAHQQLGRQKVRTNDRVGFLAPDLAHQCAGAQPLDAAAQALRGRVVRRDVGALVQIRPEVGRAVHELDVPVGVDLAKASGHVGHGVDVDRRAGRDEVLGGGGKRLCCTHVAVAGAHAEDQEFGHGFGGLRGLWPCRVAWPVVGRSDRGLRGDELRVLAVVVRARLFSSFRASITPTACPAPRMSPGFASS
jgi:hypothetical protein